MQIPERLRPPEERKRRAARRRAKRIEQHREETRRSETVSMADVVIGKKPAILGALLLLILIAGVLLGGRSATTRERVTKQRTAEQRAMTDLTALRIALERFRWDCRRYPTTKEGLRALVSDADYIGWRGYYVNMVRPDPWGQHYVYRFDNGVMTLFTMGPDQREGTEDDMVPPPPTEEEVAGSNDAWKIRTEEL
ncbi:MAG: type II secretion system protein GspG [Kiritimatiellae bacterium]|nr:type II secretion system protein GspG [Kiritimatiellia bacterium]